MGTDISMHVEYKFDKRDQWLCGDYFKFKTRRYPFIACEYEREREREYDLVPFFDNRDYSLFAVLANVRNYGHTEYIDEPRGVPEDASIFVKGCYEDGYFNTHSSSYFTLQELIDFHNKKIPIKRSGMISPEAQKNLDLGILPDTWCQGTNQVGWERREWEEENNVLVPLIEKLKERADELDLIYDFYWDSDREETRKLAYEKSANIRIVFWFD